MRRLSSFFGSRLLFMHGLVLAFVFSSYLAATIQCQGTLFIFDGKVERNRTHKSQTIEESYSFLASMDEQFWVVRMNPKTLNITGSRSTLRPQRAMGSVDYYEVGTLGTNLYRKTVFKPNLEERNLRPQKGYLGHASENIEILKDVHPTQDATGFFSVWLTLCANSYLKENAGQLMPTITTPKILPLTERLENFTWKITSLSNKAISFPSEVTFYNLGKMEEFPSSGAHPTNSMIAIKHVPPFDEGYLQSRFEVLEWAQTQDVTYPKKARFLQYVRRKGAESTNDLQVAESTTIWVNKIQRVNDQTLHLNPVNAGKLTRVQDQRMLSKKGSAANYVTSGRLLGLDSEHLQRRVDQINKFEDFQEKRN